LSDCAVSSAAYSSELPRSSKSGLQRPVFTQGIGMASNG
jgi:hypothetical protein